MIFLILFSSFLIGFFFLFLWVKVKHKVKWSPSGMGCASFISALLAALAVYAVVGYVVVMTTMILASILVLTIIAGGLWLADTLLG